MRCCIRLICFIGFLIFAVNGYAEKLEAFVDKNTIGIDEPIVLTIKVPSIRAGLSQPDLSALMNDFEVIGTASSNNVRVINGQMSSESEWDIKLLPKHSGTLTIPSVVMGNYQSNPIRIKVSDAQRVQKNTAAPVSTGQAIFIQNTIDQKNPYVDQQVIYDVKIFSTVPIMNANLQPPLLDGSPLEPVGTVTHTEQEVQGQIYTVVDQKFLLLPKQAGQTTVMPAQLQATVMAPSDYGMMGMAVPRDVQVVGKPIVFSVKPPEAGITPWLPAKKIVLSDQWSSQQWRMGDPITRTITMTAAGVGANRLPKIEIPGNQQMNTYADKPDIQTTVTSQGTITTVTQKIAIIPTGSGKIHFPPIRVSWWNTDRARPESTLLAAHDFDVLPALSATPVPVVAAPPSVENVAKLPVPLTGTIEHQDTQYWLWAVMSLLILWLLTLFFWWLQRHKQKKRPVSLKVDHYYSNDWKAVKNACKNNEAKLIAETILVFARKNWRDHRFFSLSDVCEFLNNASLTALLEGMQKSVYGKMGADWQNGAEILRELESTVRQMKKTAKQQNSKNHFKDLPPLYPE